MVVAQIRHVDHGDRYDAMLLWCPGCEDTHQIGVGDGRWTWDGNLNRPTVSPSIKVTGVQWDSTSPFHRPRHNVTAGEPVVCHSFLEAGQWRFLGDCTHPLANQTVPMVPLPEWAVR